MNFNSVIWKPVKGFEGLYEASSEGAIRPVTPRFKTSQVLKPGDNGTGHLLVCLVKDGVKKTHQVARLVYEAFFGAIPEGYDVDHINEDTRDNRLSNLQAIPHYRNMVRGTAVERSAYSHRKPVKAYLEEKEVGHFGSIKQAALMTGLDAGLIGKAAAGKLGEVGGYKWFYAESPYAKPKKLYEC